MHSIDIIKGDITRLEVDAIVNAANESLLGGGGVDGAIHRGAGKELLAECRTLKGCPTGEAKITKGYRLPAKYIIHTVGPVYHGGSKNEAALLSGCYANSLTLADTYRLKSIAFPSISTGIYRYPFADACEIALNTIARFFQANPESTVKEVLLVCFNDDDYQTYQDIANNKKS